MKSGIKYVSVLKRDLENRFDKYVDALPKTNNERKIYTSQAVIKELTEGLKWIQYRTNKGNAFKIEREKFKKWRESQTANDDSEEMEDITDEETESISETETSDD